MASKKEELEQSQKAYEDFMAFSKFIFSDDAPYDMNEIGEDNRFYSISKGLADEMGIDWENMSHEHSNSLMLNVLGELFNSIKTNEEYIPVLTISFKKK